MTTFLITGGGQALVGTRRQRSGIGIHGGGGAHATGLHSPCLLVGARLLPCTMTPE